MAVAAAHERFAGRETAQMGPDMTEVPAARFEDTASEQGSRDILDDVGAFVKASGVGPIGRRQIADMLETILGAAAGHASSRADARIAVVADVMPDDVQLVLRLYPGALWEDVAEPVGGLEMWISFPRD
jgi:hypothetical protein